MRRSRRHRHHARRRRFAEAGAGVRSKRAVEARAQVLERDHVRRARRAAASSKCSSQRREQLLADLRTGVRVMATAPGRAPAARGSSKASLSRGRRCSAQQLLLADPGRGAPRRSRCPAQNSQPCMRGRLEHGEQLEALGTRGAASRRRSRHAVARRAGHPAMCAHLDIAAISRRWPGHAPQLPARAAATAEAQLGILHCGSMPASCLELSGTGMWVIDGAPWAEARSPA